MSNYDELLKIASQATGFINLMVEVKMAIGFLKVFLDEKENFEDLYEDVCDTYSALVDAQMNLCFLEMLFENLKRKANI